MQYQELIFENEKLKLIVNFSGIEDDVAKASDLQMHIYAVNKNTYKQVFEETLQIADIRKLYNQLNRISIIRDSTISESGKFIESTDEVVQWIQQLQEVDSNILRSVLEKLDDQEKVQELIEALSITDLDNLSAAHIQQKHQQELENLISLLQLEESKNIVKEIKGIEILKKYEAGQPEKIFQNWIEKNLWIFGVEYIKKHDIRKISLFSEGDLLMESLDGFLDLIELKRPKLEYNIFNYDTNHDSYYPSSNLAKVLGQCLFYLQKLDEYKLQLENEYQIKVLRPRIKIVMGRSNDFNDKEINALRMLNSNLNHISIVTYDYLIDSGNKIIEDHRL